jgi:hypothetical protein
MTDDQLTGRLSDLMHDLAGSDDGYIEDILDRTRLNRQRATWSFPARWLPAPVGFGAGANRLFVVLALVTILALLAASAALIGDRAPDAAETRVPAASTVFLRPFEYDLAPGSALVPTTISPQVYALTEGSTTSYPGFGYEPIDGVRGITVAYGIRAATHGTGGRDGGTLMPETFLADLSRNPALAVGEATQTRLDGMPALEADVRATGEGEYPDLHVSLFKEGRPEEGVLALAFPSRLIVAAVDGGFLLVHVWAADEEELAAWLPEAQRVISSIGFAQPPLPATP